MRVNTNIVPNIVADISESQATLNTLLQEVATGKSVNTPSDNPSAAALMVNNTLETANVDRYTQNISSALSQVQQAGSVLSSVVSSLTQAVSLGTEGANSTTNSSNLAALAQQVRSILSTVVSQANASIGGVYLFGGTATGAAPYAADSSSPTGYAYTGNANANSVVVGDSLSVQINLPGSQIFSSSSKSVIGALSSLATALQSGNSAQIASATTAVNSSIQTISQAQGFYSNAESQLNSQENYLQQETVTLTTQQNNLVGANMATVATELGQAEIDNSAALAAAGRVLPNTLLNYLPPPM